MIWTDRGTVATILVEEDILHVTAIASVSCRAGSRTKLFQACIGACRFDMQLALHLLPYLVQNVVSNGSDEARHGVQMEVWLGMTPRHQVPVPAQCNAVCSLCFAG